MWIKTVLQWFENKINRVCMFFYHASYQLVTKTWIKRCKNKKCEKTLWLWLYIYNIINNKICSRITKYLTFWTLFPNLFLFCVLNRQSQWHEIYETIEQIIALQFIMFPTFFHPHFCGYKIKLILRFMISADLNGN